MAVALIGLVASAWVAALILYQFIPTMTMQSAWLYATPLSILSSAIIIPSVTGLKENKKEFHIYESTFSDIIGIMMFYFLTGKLNPAEDSGVIGFYGKPNLDYRHCPSGQLCDHYDLSTYQEQCKVVLADCRIIAALCRWQEDAPFLVDYHPDIRSGDRQYESVFQGKDGQISGF